jgi:dTDP-4-amino-4,6-dideoxygalactose transaminase
LFGILVDQRIRDSLVEIMNDSGVIVKTWPSLSTLDCYKRDPIEFAESIAKRIVLLPISNKTSESEVNYCCDLLIKNYEKLNLSIS